MVMISFISFNFMAKKKDYRQLLTTPYETGIKNFSSVAKFFQYYAPCIDSAQSPGTFDAVTAIRVLKEMLDETEMSLKTRIIKRIQPASWKKDGLDSDELDFEDSKVLCDRYSSETELHALLRHIRNSLAHGYLYVWRKKKGDYIFMIDFDANKHKATAKLMVSMPILERWKAILENQIV